MAPKPRDQSSTDTTAVTYDGLPLSAELLATLGGNTCECPIKEDGVMLTFFCCERGGSKKEPRFVRGRTPGLCAVRVTVVRPSGSKKKSVAYVAMG